MGKDGVLSEIIERCLNHKEPRKVVRIKIEAVSLDSTSIKVHSDGTGALKILDLIARTAKSPRRNVTCDLRMGDGRCLLDAMLAGPFQRAAQAWDALGAVAPPPDAISEAGVTVRRHFRRLVPPGLPPAHRRALFFPAATSQILSLLQPVTPRYTIEL